MSKREYETNENNETNEKFMIFSFISLFSFVSYSLFRLSHLVKSFVSSHPQNPMRLAVFQFSVSVDGISMCHFLLHVWIIVRCIAKSAKSVFRFEAAGVDCKEGRGAAKSQLPHSSAPERAQRHGGRKRDKEDIALSPLLSSLLCGSVALWLVDKSAAWIILTTQSAHPIAMNAGMPDHR
jgi:hypothetical protein